jgi:hypothetical protein
VGKASAAARKKSRKRHRRLLWFEGARWSRGAKLPISNAMNNASSRIPLYHNRNEKIGPGDRNLGVWECGIFCARSVKGVVGRPWLKLWADLAK